MPIFLYLCTFLIYNMDILIPNEPALADAAQQLLDEFPDDRVFCFYGEMGAGKTTFIKELCRCLNVTDTTSSPTFAIVNEYVTECGEPVYHFDFYRIEKVEDAYQIGTDDYFSSGDYCFAEWPENVPEIIRPDFVKVGISVQPDGSRRITTRKDA